MDKPFYMTNSPSNFWEPEEEKSQTFFSHPNQAIIPLQTNFEPV